MQYTSELTRKQVINRKLAHLKLTATLHKDEVYFAEQHRAVVCNSSGLGYTVAKATPITTLKVGEFYTKIVQLKNDHNGPSAAERLLKMHDDRTAEQQVAGEDLLNEMVEDMTNAYDASNSQAIPGSIKCN